MKKWSLIAGLILVGGLAWYLLHSYSMGGAPGEREMASPSTGEAEFGMWT